ncbi:hypothetical protein CC86DRAFT_402870 [Ophiobolus disseminans]|uniref:F-box domain-containing protein n=1 Tax=Ophiobolus disseminans TaxID=1469910 RepID=A0A6A7AE44_9PLEO|nr:hypothetical protein CC86DRAFT_402870 [Ophiobolus disseminans]
MDRIAQMNRRRPAERDFECCFLVDNERDFSNIRTIHVQQDFTTTEILRFMLLPSLREMKATYLDIMKPPDLPSAWAEKRSTITTLELSGCTLWRIDLSAIHRILSFCPHLRILRAQVPMISEYGGGNRPSQERQLAIPAALDFMLEPVKNILKELKLFNGRHRIRPHCTVREHLYKLLPPTLRRLKLEFPRSSGIFYHHLKGKPFLNQSPKAIPQQRYNWISTQLHDKSTSLPNLAKLEMTDPPGCVGFHYWETAIWTPPSDCETDGVELDIKFVHPKPGSEMDSWNDRPRIRCHRYEYSEYNFDNSF